MNYNTKLTTSKLSKTLIAAFSLLLLTGLGASADLTVGADGGENDYNTISAALDNIEGDDIEDTITVHSQEDSSYSGFEVTTDDVTIQAANGDQPVIEGESKKGVLVNGASDITIDGFEITNNAQENGESYAVRVEGELDNFVLNNSIVKDVSADHRATAVVIDMDPSGSNPSTTEDVTIENTEIRNIKANGLEGFDGESEDSKAKAISVNGDVTNLEVVDNTVEDIGNESTAKPRGLNLVSDSNGDGPTNFEVSENTFSDITSGMSEPGNYEGPATVFIGDYSPLGEENSLTNNKFNDGIVRNCCNADTTLNAEENYWGDPDGPSGEADGNGVSVSTSVSYAPWYSDENFDTLRTDESGTIQSAIDAASEDDTIEVEAGTYDESVTIDTPGVTLEGGYPETEGSSDDRVEEDEAVVDGRIKVVADGVAVTGLTVDGTDERAVAVGEAEGVTVSNNIIEDSKRGIQGDNFGRPTDLTVKNNLISTDYGIASTEEIETLTVEDNTFQTSEEGIGLGEDSVLADEEGVSGMFDDNTWELEGGYAVKEYRDDGDVYVAEGGSIQSAFDVAGVKNPNDVYVTEGSTSVIVDSGSYSGFELERDVDVVGPNADASGNAEERPSEEATIEGTVNIRNLGSEAEVSLRGFRIETSEQASAVDINKLETDERSVTVSNNIIDGEGSANGVGINSDATVRIRENLIQDVQNGVLLRNDASDSGADVHVKENMITGATGYDPDGSWTDGSAVKIMEKGSNLDVAPEEISGNTFESNDVGFWLADHQGDSGEAKKTSSDSIDDGFVSTILSNNDFDQAVTITNDDGENLTAVYSSIQDAVDAAEEEATVRVGEGAYEENLEIGTENLVLESAQQGEATIEGNIFIGNDPSEPVSATGTVVKGFTITEPDMSGDGRGIGITESDDAKLVNNTLKGFRTQVSLDFAGDVPENVTILSNSFMAGELGEDTTNVAVGSTEDVVDLEIRENSFETLTAGVDLGPGAEEVTIEENRFSGTQRGVKVFADSVEITSLKSNDFIDTKVSTEGSDVTAEDNYWGQSSGPTGDQVSENVDYRPWRMNSKDVAGYDEVITFNDADSWSAFSVVGAVDEAATASGDAEVLSYNAGWTSPDVNDLTSVDAAFVKDTKAVGVNYVEDPGTVSRSLGEGWNFVGAYDNGEDQSIRNVFGPVESSIDVFQRPDYNEDKTSDRTSDIVAGNIISTSNWGSNSAFAEDASVFDGYWLKASENATLSTTPDPVGQG